MTNPNNAIGTNAAYVGRTSVDAFNDITSIYDRGILTGWNPSPGTGLTVNLGGVSGTRDVAIAKDNVGNVTTINNITQQPIPVSIGTAPGSNSRIDSIVAYVNNPPQGDDLTSDNPSACGLIVVQGATAASPSAPNESAIRAAITADGGTGATAYYVVLTNVTIAAGTTDLTASNIEKTSPSRLQSWIANRSMFTADNLSVASDTPAAWRALLETGYDRGVFWTRYTQTGRFANQPQQYGFLETAIFGPEVLQRWHDGPQAFTRVRWGNTSGWHTGNTNSAHFMKLLDSSATCIASAQGTINNLPSVKIKAPAKGGIFVIVNTDYTWGYGGGTFYVGAGNATGLTKVMGIAGATTGGDQIGRNLVGTAYYSGAQENTEYTIPAIKNGSPGDGTKIVEIIAMWFPNGTM